MQSLLQGRSFRAGLTSLRATLPRPSPKNGQGGADQFSYIELTFHCPHDHLVLDLFQLSLGRAVFSQNDLSKGPKDSTASMTLPSSIPSNLRWSLPEVIPEYRAKTRVSREHCQVPPMKKMKERFSENSVVIAIRFPQRRTFLSAPYGLAHLSVLATSATPPENGLIHASGNSG